MAISSRYIKPAVDAVPIAASTAVDFMATYKQTVTLAADTAGDVVGVTEAGETRTIAYSEGQERPISWRSITASTTADVVAYIWKP